MRDSLKNTDPLALAAEYTSANESGKNSLLVSALENAPVPMLPGDIVVKGRQSRLERANPVIAARLHDLRLARGHLQSTIDGLRNQVREQADLLEPIIPHHTDQADSA